jgi:hypothetical protein
LSATPDVRGDCKAASHVHDIIKIISFVHGFGDESLVLNPSPPTCHRLDHHGISNALTGDDCLARTFHRGSIVVVNFYVQAKSAGDLFDVQLVPTEWIVIGQSDSEFVVSDLSRSYTGVSILPLCSAAGGNNPGHRPKGTPSQSPPHGKHVSLQSYAILTR